MGQGRRTLIKRGLEVLEFESINFVGFLTSYLDLIVGFASVLIASSLSLSLVKMGASWVFKGL